MFIHQSPFFIVLKNRDMICEKVKVKDVFTSLNISDSWCKSKLERFNAIVDEFMIEAYDLQTLKIGQYFPNDWNDYTTIVPEYPLLKVWMFYGEWCNLKCAIDNDICCWKYKKLLLNEGYYDALQQNEFAIWCDDVRLKASWVNSGIMVYTRHLWHFTSLEDEMEIDSVTLSLLKNYMQNVYAIKENSDSNTAQYYYNRFQDLMQKANLMYKNTIKYIQPGNALNRVFEKPLSTIY